MGQQDLRKRGWADGAGPVLIGLALTIVLGLSWMRWTDPVVDFGRELYAPWQVSQGQEAQVGVHTFYGPLSVYVNGLWFWLFGPHFLTLVLANIVILGLVAAAIYAIVRALSTRLAATVCGLVFACVFAAGHLSDVANFNFVTPYSHELTHGVALGLGALYCFMRWMKTRGAAWAAAAGLCAGLAFLTKPEIFAAVAGALAAGVASGALGPRERRPGRSALVVLVVAAAVPVIVSLVLLGAQATLGSWPYLVDSKVRQMSYARHMLGLDDPITLIKSALWTTAALTLFMGVAILAARRVRDGGRRIRVVGAVAGAAAVGVVAVMGTWWVPRERYMWLSIGSALPLVVGGALVVECVRVWRQRRDGVWNPVQPGIVATLVFALLMLAKLGLFPRLYHYGFALALPGTMVLVVILVDRLPALLERYGKCGWVIRGTGVAILAVVAWKALAVSWGYMEKFDVPIGSGADRFLVDYRGPILAETLAFIEREARPGETVTPLPEGLALNFLARRRTSVRYLSYVPSDLIMFGEEQMLDDMKAHPPDWIVLIDRATPDYGTTWFGVDYAQKISGWVAKNYVEAHRAGARPMAGEGFGVVVLRRKDLAAAASRP